ncbi:MAG: ACP S-malonyltransferase [Balneola sp.]|nr:ACP S-malonyltransferase [Balneola sp.]MBO6652339.1 ACP S-malonyltransferase [Balneola sp.]MBO6710842.1 ACP S-malonyltransferase [Balneola sp.]MBO6799529.1 ACP S-malonyltransferase [Balneola sp.]MBO6870261.1 ACP S-malonyltransferase [Balneola sp.]
MSTAYLFPGQGSQFVGMGKDHNEANSDFAKMVEDANEILGIDLKSVMFEGPEEKLKQTEFTQPAIFLHSVALYKTLDATPDMVAGHSLGEFSALVACNAVSFEDALKIVRRRGELMQAAGASNPGTMAAIIGMDDDKVELVCKKAEEQTGKEVVAANYNCPGQLVISGYTEAVKAAVDIAKEDGARMAMLLPVSGAFHSSLMEPAFVGLKESLENLKINTPSCPIYSNFTAKPTSDVDEIRSNLLDQLMNPVRWTQTLQNMIANGATSFVEVGPGKVLQGLVKRTDRKAEISGHQ